MNVIPIMGGILAQRGGALPDLIWLLVIGFVLIVVVALFRRPGRPSEEAVDQDSGAGKRDYLSPLCYFLGAGFVTGPAGSFRRDSQSGVSAAAFSALMRKT